MYSTGKILGIEKCWNCKQSKAKQKAKHHNKTEKECMDIQLVTLLSLPTLWCWEVQKDHSSKAALLIQPVYFSFSILLSHFNNHSYLQELIIILIYLLVQLSDSSIHYIITANILLYQAIKQTNRHTSNHTVKAIGWGSVTGMAHVRKLGGGWVGVDDGLIKYFGLTR